MLPDVRPQLHASQAISDLDVSLQVRYREPARSDGVAAQAPFGTAGFR